MKLVFIQINQLYMCYVFSKAGYVAKLGNAGKTMRKTIFRLFILLVCVHICEKSVHFNPYCALFRQLKWLSHKGDIGFLLMQMDRRRSE